MEERCTTERNQSHPYLRGGASDRILRPTGKLGNNPGPHPNQYQISPRGPSACGEQAVRTQESRVGPSLPVCTEMWMAGEQGPPNSPSERDMTGPRRLLPKSKAEPIGMPSLDTLG